MKLRKIPKYLFIFIIAAFIGCGFLGDISHKTDAEMVENFHKNKDKFEDLLEMVRQDEKRIGKQLFRIDNTWVAPENLESFGITKERVEKYRRMFIELDIPRGFYAYGDGDFYIFITSAQGLGVSGSSKSYVWSKDVSFPNLIKGDLDEYFKNHSKSSDYPVYRHIVGNWFLQYDAD